MSRLPTRFVRPRAIASSPVVAGFRPAAAALAVATAFALQTPLPLRAQPVGPNVIAGQASFARTGSNLLVTTQNAAGSNHSAINWQSFSVPAGSITRFNQPTATSMSINRVVGSDPSAIFGTLSSNGRLVLVNPAGIAVGAGAVVDTAGFTASTLPMREADAIAGRLLFSGSGGAIQVDGNVIARGGDIVLLAPQVQAGSAATLQADGSVVLAAGQKAEITGRGLEGITLEVQAGDQAVNLGQLKGDAVGIFAGTLKHSGLINAQAVSTEGGKVVLKAQGDVLVDGSITAVSGTKGGSVDVLGERVGLLAGASIDASGANGGGQVRIGGDYQGRNADVPNAKRTYVDAGASIQADATGNGDGGRVIVWSDEVTRMHGQVSARGGANGGNGGFSEVSGKQVLAFDGKVDLRAPHGQAGTLLLDPNDVDIVPAGTTLTNASSQSGQYFEYGTGTTQIDAGVLGTQAGSSNIQVITSYGSSGPNGGQIHLLTGANVSWPNANSLSLHADSGIVLDGQVSAANGSLHLQTTTGNISQGSASQLTLASLIAQAGQYGSTLGPGSSVLLDGPGNQVGTLSGYAYGPGAEFHFKNNGDLTVGTVSNAWASGNGISTYDGSNAGAISIAASGGNLTVTGGFTQGGSISLAATGNVGIDAANLYAYGNSAPGTGTLNIAAGAAVNVATVTNSSVSLQGRDGVSIASSGGNVNLGATTPATATAPGYTTAVYVSTTSAPIDITAVGSITGPQSSFTTGGMNGHVHLTATGSGGSVGFNSISASGSSADGAGGGVKIAAQGGVTGGNIYADGAYSYGSVGAQGGNVTVQSAGGDIVLAYVSGQGGGNYSLGAGGGGGSVVLQTPGKIQITEQVTVDGGSAYTGNGGNAGSIGIQAGTGTDLAYLAARGGQTSAYYAPTGNGGAGGSVNVSVSSAGGALSVNTVDAHGGWASSIGAGGKGGSITLGALGTGATVTVNNDMSVRGGDAYSGTGGAGGAVNVQADGLAKLMFTANAGGGSGARDTSVSAGGAGGTITIGSVNGSVTLGQRDPGTSSISSYGGASADGGYAYSMGTGGAGGAIVLSAPAGSVTVTNQLSAQGGSSSGGTSGSGRTSGAVNVAAQTGLWINSIHTDAGGSSASIGGGGQIAAHTNAGDAYVGSISAEGSPGGNVSVGSGSGNVVVDWVDASGRYAYSMVAGGDGGGITLSAGGTVTATSQLSAGGGGSSSLSGGKGGAIAVTAAGNVQLMYATANGGYGQGNTGPGNTGGDGGTIQITSTNAGIFVGKNVPATSTYSYGGLSAAGGHGYSFAAGGAGGAIVLSAPAGNVNAYASLSATAGGSDNGRAGDARSNAVTVNASGTIAVDSMQADGGFSGYSSGQPSGAGGGIQVTGGGNVSVNWADAEGSPGGKIQLTSTGGNVTLNGADASGRYGYSSTAGGNGGQILLSAPAGTVSTIYSLNANGGGSGSTGGAGGTIAVNAAHDVNFAAGGDVAGGQGSLSGGGAGGSISISSSGGNLNVSGSLGSSGGGSSAGTAALGGAILLQAQAGSISSTNSINAQGGYANEGGTAGKGGSITVLGTQDVQVSSASARGGDAYSSLSARPGGGGGTVLLSSSAGNVVVTGAADVGGGAGSPAGNGGTITISAASGGITLNNASLSSRGGNAWRSGGAGGSGGSVTLQAKNDIAISTALTTTTTPPITTTGMPYGQVVVDGGYGSDSTGGNAGTMQIASSAGSVVGTGYYGLSAQGGQGSVGGTGGTVNVDAAAGVNLSRVHATGGFGYLGSGGGLGGTGGAINVRATGKVLPGSYDASGGTGGSGNMSSSVGAGAGGTGGTIKLEAGAPTFDLSGFSLYAMGGSGGYGGTAPNTGVPGGTGGAGGAGGSIQLAASAGDLTLGSGYLTVEGGSGGSGGYGAAGANGLSPGAGGPGGKGGNGGVGGSIAVAATGNLSMGAANLRARGGSGGSAGSGGSGGYDNVTVAPATPAPNGPSGPNGTEGSASTGGQVNVRAGNNLSIDTSLDTGTAALVARAGGSITQSTGTIMTHGAAVTLSAGDPAAPTPQAGATLMIGGFIDTTGGGVVAGGAVKLSAPGAVTIDPAVTAGPVNVTSTTQINLDQPIYSSAPGDAVTLNAPSIVVGPNGAINLSDPSARWLMYLPTPVGNTFGGLVSGNYALWNRAAGSAVAETGNRYVFAYQPTIGIVANAGTKVYDGTAISVDGRYTSSPLIDASAYGNVWLQDVFTGALALPTASKNVGSYTIGLGTLGVAGYAVSSFTGNVATITPRTLNVAAAAASKVYDGGTATTASYSDDRVAGDVLAVSGTANFKDKNVGKAKPVNVTGLGVTGTDAANYVLAGTTTSASADITPRMLNVGGSALGKVYDGTTAASLSFTDDRVAGDVLAVSGTGTFSDRNVGTAKPVSIAGVGIAGTDAGNYVLGTTPTASQASITPAPITIGAVASSKAYDGSTNSAQAPVLVAGGIMAGDRATFSQQFDTRHVGTGKTLTPVGAITDGNGGKNYTLVLQSSTGGTITPAALTVGAGADSKTYDGTTSSSASPVLVSGTLYGSDTAIFVQAFDSRNAGSGKTLAPAGAINDGNGGRDYAVTLLSSKNGVITPAPITVTASAASKVYDGTTVSAAAPTLTGGKLYGSDAPAFTQAYDNRNAGTGKLLTPTGTVNDGNGGGNYSVTLASSSNGTITPAPITLSASADSKAYDGTTSSLALPAITGGALVGSDTIASRTQAFQDRNAGTGKVLVPSATVNDGNGGNNYTVTRVNSSAGVITPAALTIDANNVSKTEGTQYVFNGSEFTATGLVSGDSVASVTLTSAGAPASASVGAYPIVPSNAASTANFLASNYRITYLNGALAVTPRELPAVQNQVATFQALFVQEAVAQASKPAEDKKNPGGKEDIVITDTQCKQ